MKRKIWNQLTQAVLTTAIGTTMSIVSSADVTFGSPLNDLLATGQSTTEPTVQFTTENQPTTVDTRNIFAPSQSEINSKPNTLENSDANSASPAILEQKTPGHETPSEPTSDHTVPVTRPQPKKVAETRPTSNDNAAPAKKTQPERINQTKVPRKPTLKVSNRPRTVGQAKGNVAARRRGMASWYGPGFSGRRTASGERFNQHGMTAAHRTLPIGTKVKVTNLSNGRSVVVRINDRGPFGGGRIIDLSHGAARLIGVVQSGVAPVLLEVLGR